MSRRTTRRRSALRNHLLESLEPRIVLSANALGQPELAQLAPPLQLATVTRAIVAGDPNGTPADSPSQRVDPNTPTSPFAGVGSLFMDLGNGSGYICTGSLISPTHVLTAGHCLDIDSDGVADFTPGNVNFFLNIDNNEVLSSAETRVGSALHIHPDYTGFANPSVLDDVAVIELASPAPAGVPIYGLDTEPFVNIEPITLVGYGTTGDAVGGYISGSASFTTKRAGENRADVYSTDDEGSGAREGFQLDFDGPSRGTNVFGSPRGSNLTLGNDVETTIGGGDSGGPSFVRRDGELLLFGVNTYTGGGGKASAPRFGSIAGGMVVSTYATWIQEVIQGTPPVTNSAPIADAGEAQTVTVGTQVNLDGSGSSDPDGDLITGYAWSLDSAPTGSTATLDDNASVQPSFIPNVAGDYVVSLTVTDEFGLPSTADTVTITANAPSSAAETMHIHDFSGNVQLKARGRKWTGIATVTIFDDLHAAVPGAVVTGSWSGDTSGLVSGTTATDGTVQFSTGNLNSGESVTLTITDVNHSGLTYSPADNDDPDGDGNAITILRSSATAAGTLVRAPERSAAAAGVPLTSAASEEDTEEPDREVNLPIASPAPRDLLFAADIAALAPAAWEWLEDTKGEDDAEEDLVMDAAR